ncbi:putative movement protein [Hyptis latent virus]|uniref:Movement protein n=1 Tax=Hyptis latent virus TaxID=2963947 RepID=A0AAE9SHV4_9RHAB|nr:putative movement protein [Hyptis latent virus]
MNYGSYTYTVKSEIVAEGDNSVPLTKRLNILQRVATFGAENLRIRSMVFVYKSRLGSRGKGVITASIYDNRVDPDLGNPVISRIDFPAESDINTTWESPVWFAKSDLRNASNPPLILDMNIAECNVLPGFSLGCYKLVVTIITAPYMERVIYKRPTATITTNATLIDDEDVINQYKVRTEIKGKKIQTLDNSSNTSASSSVSRPLSSQSARFKTETDKSYPKLVRIGSSREKTRIPMRLSRP